MASAITLTGENEEVGGKNKKQSASIRHYCVSRQRYGHPISTGPPGWKGPLNGIGSSVNWKSSKPNLLFSFTSFDPLKMNENPSRAFASQRRFKPCRCRCNNHQEINRFGRSISSPDAIKLWGVAWCRSLPSRRTHSSDTQFCTESLPLANSLESVAYEPLFVMKRSVCSDYNKRRPLTDNQLACS